MLSAVLLGGALALGTPPQLVAVVALAVYRPAWFLIAAAGWALVARLRGRDGPSADDEARYLHGLAAELRGGSSLRIALAAAAGRAPALPLAGVVRRADAGRPIAEIAPGLRRALPVNGRLAAPAAILAAETGGPAAALFGGLAARAAAHGELARERRALTAQARLSAVVVAGAPLALLAVLTVTGAGGSLTGAGPAGVVIVAAGLALEVAGALVVWLMIRRAER